MERYTMDGGVGRMGLIGQLGGCHNCHSERVMGPSWDSGRWSGQEDTWVAVLTWGLFCLPGAIWQCLRTFLVCPELGEVATNI